VRKDKSTSDCWFVLTRGIQVGEEGAGCGTVALSQRWGEQAGK